MATRSLYKALILMVLCITVFSGMAFAAACDTQKEGVASVSPSEVNFYLTSLDGVNTPDPWTVTVTGFAYPQDDGCATMFTWAETTEYCWVVTKEDQWITLNGSTDATLRNTDGQGSFTIGIDLGALADFLSGQSGTPTTVTGKVIVTTTLTGTPTIEIPVRVHLNGFSGQKCNAPKEGMLAVSPSAITFYVSAEDTKGPMPVTVQVDGMAYAGDDGDPDTSTWVENTEFCWMASSSMDWITFGGQGQNVLKGEGQGGTFQVGVDIDKLSIPQDIYLMGGSVTYEGNITIVSNLNDEKTIRVKVYVNSLREVEEETVSSSAQLYLPLNIPVSRSLSGALYILVEHPRLLPNQVYAYRYDPSTGARFDLFSERGHLEPNAGELFFAPDVQNVPAMIPYSQGQGYPPAPYQPYDMPSPTDVNGTAMNLKGYIPVNIGEGLSLHGLEGDIIVRALVGDPGEVENWRLWKELLYKVVHVMPISGTWVVTDEINGRSYGYTDEEGNTYPMVLREQDGVLQGQWIIPGSSTPLTVQYLDLPQGGYAIYFQETSPLYGLVDYYYRIESFDGQGYVEGTWQYRLPGESQWSMPQRFSAVRQEIVIPLDRNCNCYLVNGTVNDYPMQFYVDTGASTVFLSADDAQYMGIDLNDPNQCVDGTAVGVGGEVSVKYCNVDIEIEGRLLKQGVLAAFSDTWTGPGLLGMTFLDTVHVSKTSDGTLVIGP